MIVIQVPTLSAFPDQNFLPVSEIGGTHSQLTTEIRFGKVAVPAVRVMGAMPLELSDTEKAALIALLSATITADRFPRRVGENEKDRLRARARAGQLCRTTLKDPQKGSGS